MCLALSSVFSPQSLLTVILFLICTCAYIRSLCSSLDEWKRPLHALYFSCF
uniref:Protein kish n=1 Tax=Salvator merianae TaxID=96440 RepID=A0A8D0B523_SALMN